jgi:hypothetical protein
MESQALQPSNRPGPRPIKLVLVRANGPLFYCAAGAALLEGIAPLYAQRLLRFLGDEDLLGQWIQRKWLARKAARAKALRAYVERTWPEFDWNASLEECRTAAQADGGLGPHRPTLAHELLARCVAAAQSALFYRTLARWAEDPELREMARGYAIEETRSFRQFRTACVRCRRFHPLGLIASWCTAVACVRATRDTYVPLAFRALSSQCGPHVPFEVLEYRDFVSRMRRIVERHGNVGTPERILFRSWMRRPRLARIKQKRQQTPDWFKPMFKAAA